MKINRQLNSFVKKSYGVQNVIVKSFLTRSGQSVLLEIFCAILTQWMQSLGRPVADGQGLSKRNRILSVLLNWYAVRKTNLGPANISEILKSWQEYPAVLFNESLREICSFMSEMLLCLMEHIVLPLWHNDVAVPWICCNYFLTNCWRTNSVWALILCRTEFQSVIYTHK